MLLLQPVHMYCPQLLMGVLYDLLLLSRCCCCWPAAVHVLCPLLFMEYAALHGLLQLLKPHTVVLERCCSRLFMRVLPTVVTCCC